MISWRRYFLVSLVCEYLGLKLPVKAEFCGTSFPEIMSIQVSFLVNKIKNESEQGVDCATRKQLRDKITSLTLPQTRHATGALEMIWNHLQKPLDPPVPEPDPVPSPESDPFPDWSLLKRALLKSISTGIFTDIQIHAYSKISNGIPRDPRPLFISSILIEGWWTTLATRGFEATIHLFTSPDNRPKS